MGELPFIALTAKSNLKKTTPLLLLIFIFLFAFYLYQNFYLPEVDPKSSGPFPVTFIYDGDTIAVKLGNREQKVRLVGIDTPEVIDPRRPVACFGHEASAKTKELLTGQKVFLEIDSSQNLVDKYGRLLRYVYRSDGLFVNQYLVQNGFAHEYSYQNIPHRFATSFRQLENTARENHLGLWDNNICPN